PAPTGAVSSQGKSTWESTITNNTGTQVDYKFLFYIADPRVGTEGGTGDYAGLSIDIFLNGSSVWSAFAEMDGCSLSYSGTLNTPISQPGCEAYFASFTAAVDLGTFAAGAEF